MDERDHGSLVLAASAVVDGGGAKRLPDDGLANVGGDEERDSRAQSVAVLQQLVQQQHNHTRKEELQHNDERIACVGG